MKNLIVCVFVTIGCTTCNNRFENESSVISTYDTVLAGYPSMSGIIPYTKEHTTIPITSLKYYDSSGVDIEIGNNRRFYYIDEAKPMMAQLIGFKDESKYLPLRLFSEGIQVDSIGSKNEYYTVKLLEDTAIVDIMLDCGHGKIKLLSYPINGDTTSVLHDSADMYRVGYGKFVRLKKIKPRTENKRLRNSRSVLNLKLRCW